MVPKANLLKNVIIRKLFVIEALFVGNKGKITYKYHNSDMKSICHALSQRESQFIKCLQKIFIHPNSVTASYHLIPSLMFILRIECQ